MSKELSSAGGRPVASQIRIIRVISVLEILLSIVVILSQTVAIGASNVYATRSLTGIWTSWFFFIAAGLALFWSSRCTFNGLLSVLVLQIVGATMTVPLFVSCCILLAVYEFQWTAEKESGK